MGREGPGINYGAQGTPKQNPVQTAYLGDGEESCPDKPPFAPEMNGWMRNRIARMEGSNHQH